VFSSEGGQDLCLVLMIATKGMELVFPGRLVYQLGFCGNLDWWPNAVGASGGCAVQALCCSLNVPAKPTNFARIKSYRGH